MNIDRTIATVCCLSATAVGCAELPDDGTLPDLAAPRLAAETEVTAARAAEITIASISTAEGCAGTATITDDGRAAELRFTRLEATVDAPMARSTADCQVRVFLVVPPGQTYALEELSAEGMLSLADGMTATVEASAHPAQAAPIAMRGRYFRGPVEGPLVFFADFSEADRTFAACADARELAVDLRLTLKNDNAMPSAPGWIALTRFRPLRIALRPCASA